MPYLDVDGAKLHYVIEGSGTPVVLVNGMCGSVDYFSNLIEPLSKNYTAVSFDTRGNGKTEHDREFHAEDYISDLENLVDYLKFDKFHLFGWSVGTCVCQEYAVRHPERIISLTLVSAFGRRPARSQFILESSAKAATKYNDPNIAMDAIRAFGFTEEFFKKVEDQKRELPTSEVSPRGFLMQASVLDEFDVRNLSEKIRVPTLSIHGLDDIMVDPSMGDEIADKIPGCKKFRIKGRGHNIPAKDYLEEFMKHIADCERDMAKR